MARPRWGWPSAGQRRMPLLRDRRTSPPSRFSDRRRMPLSQQAHHLADWSRRPFCLAHGTTVRPTAPAKVGTRRIRKLESRSSTEKYKQRLALELLRGQITSQLSLSTPSYRDDEGRSTAERSDDHQPSASDKPYEEVAGLEHRAHENETTPRRLREGNYSLHRRTRGPPRPSYQSVARAGHAFPDEKVDPAASTWGLLCFLCSLRARGAGQRSGWTTRWSNLGIREDFRIGSAKVWNAVADGQVLERGGS